MGVVWPPSNHPQGANWNFLFYFFSFDLLRVAKPPHDHAVSLVTFKLAQGMAEITPKPTQRLKRVAASLVKRKMEVLEPPIFFFKKKLFKLFIVFFNIYIFVQILISFLIFTMTYSRVSIFYWVNMDFRQFYRRVLDGSTIFIFSRKRDIICDTNWNRS